MKEIEIFGYIPDTSWVSNKGRSFNLDEKKKLLYFHSEKIAVTYALMKLPPESTITIINNLRICGDCHSIMKLISQVRKCRIIIRDVNRFHHFEHGKCSCGDIW